MASIIRVDDIQDSGGNSYLSSDGSGTFTTSGLGLANTPMWYVRRTTDQTLNENAYTKIQWNSETIDTDSAFDNATNFRFTCPSGKAGKYYLSTGVGFYDCSAQEHHYVLFYKNGSNVSADPTGITTVADDTGVRAPPCLSVTNEVVGGSVDTTSVLML